MQPSDEDIEIWRRFKGGETTEAIAKSIDAGKSTVLKIVLLVESGMATSKFYNVEFDSEGCPDPVSVKVRPPKNLKKLEEWLKNA